MSFVQVEHYRPKGVEAYLHLAYAWENLHAACQMCNGSKREQFDESSPPVIPTDHDPLEHIRFEAGLQLQLVRRVIQNRKKADDGPRLPAQRVAVEEAFRRLDGACRPSGNWSTLVRSEIEEPLRALHKEWDNLIRTT